MDKQVESKTPVKSSLKVRLPRKSLVLPILSILVVPLAIFSTYFYLKQRPDVLGVVSSSEPKADQAEESLLVVARLSKIMQLPDEQPTVATVTDVEKLTAQPFFKNSKNGDKVIIFAGAKRAILYRDQENKIIEVGLVNSQGSPQSDNSQQRQEVKAEPTPNPIQFRIAYFNGSGQVGAGRKVEDSLKAAIPETRTTARAIANKTDYEGNLVVDIGGGRAEDANRIAAAISGTVVPLPEGERTPDDADFLVIVGSQEIVNP